MKVYKRGDNGEILMHSDTYLGEDYTSPNLVHYKYLRKEIRNGHTYYIYDDSELKRAEKVNDFAKKRLEKGYYDDGTYTSKTYNKNGTFTTTGHSYVRLDGTVRKNSVKDRLDKKIFQASEKYVVQHRKQKIKDIPKRIFSRAVSAVSKILRFFRGD